MIKPRRGMTITEMMVVMSINFILFSICAGMASLLVKIDRACRSGMRDSTGIERLRTRFLKDVHGAETATIDDDPIGPKSEPSKPGRSLAIVLFDRHKMVYRIDGKRLIRSFEVDGKPREDAFAFGSLVPVGFERTGDGRGIVSLKFEGNASVHVRIDAAIGFDGRFNDEESEHDAKQ